MSDLPFDANDDADGSAGIDLTSMIDVTFLLIIFWLVVASIAQEQPQHQISLAQAAGNRAAGVGKPLLVDLVASDKDAIWYNGRSWSLDTFNAHFTEQPLELDGRDVVLRVDRKADAELANRVARLCRLHGAGAVSFAHRVAAGGGGT
ncbi:MAG: hypothetical protein BIFFINMI_04100 [Phycisphaerae bacterium]|nr:hypothetical protein [Phycisphaerae bacterium]